MTQRVGRYMHTSNGKKFWPFDPRPEEVHIEVIAHHLSMTARWQGATRDFLSVAEHSYWCSVCVEPGYELEALLHDGSEGYIGDLIRPLKYDERFREPFKHVEELVERAIAERFGLRYPYPAAIKAVDEAVCAAEEIQAIVKDPSDEWRSGILHDDSVVAPIKIQFWEPAVARRAFLGRFHDIMEQRRVAA